MSSVLAFLDFEASSLDLESWPVEVGYALSTGPSDAFLLARDPSWSMAHWDRRSAHVHGISLRDLEAEGLAPDVALERLRVALEGMVVVSDAPEFDRFWLQRLADAAGAPAPFEVLDWETALPTRLRAKTWRAIVQEAERLSPRTHRAGPDARAMRETWRLAWDAAHQGWAAR